MNRDFLTIAVRSLRHRKLRTWLTVIGIVIGVGAIVALITVSSGLESAINDQFERMGTNRIFVYPKGVFSNLAAEGITEDDVDTVEEVAGIEWASPYLFGSKEGEHGRDRGFFQNIFGIEADDNVQEEFEAFDINFIKGRGFKKNERGVIIFGFRAADNAFDKDIGIGGKISFEDMQFKVVGILEEVGNPDDDRNVYIPMEDARELFEEPEKVTMIDIKLKDGMDVNEVAEKIERKLEKARDDEAFEVVTPDQLLRQFGNILNILNIVLGGIAGISIIVGGIGIMNSSYTSVLERTKDIGIMKAVGAKNKDILRIFLIESGLIGVIGGVIGIAFGTLISLGISAGLGQVGLEVQIGINWKLWVFSLMFAFGVGVVSGYFPAKKAAGLKPINAIRGI